MASVRIFVLLEIYAYHNAKKSSIFAAAEKPTYIQILFNKSHAVGSFYEAKPDIYAVLAV
jgi:hypothetical protein